MLSSTCNGFINCIPLSCKTSNLITSSRRRGRAFKGTDIPVVGGVAWVRIPLETYIFILIFSLPERSEQLSGAHANEIKQEHSPVVTFVLDPRYD